MHTFGGLKNGLDFLGVELQMVVRQYVDTRNQIWLYFFCPPFFLLIPCSPIRQSSDSSTCSFISVKGENHTSKPVDVNSGISAEAIMSVKNLCYIF